MIEMAIVIIVVGIIISIVAGVLPSLIASSKLKQAQATLEKMDYALQGYLAANGRCPCPDTDNDGKENRTTGASPPTDDTCVSYIGQIPYATIGLASALDPWQEPIRYGVYVDLIRTQTSNLCAATPCSLCLSDFGINPNPAYLRTSDNTNTNNQAYVLVSGGPKDLDGTGGFFDGRNGDATAEDFDTPNRIIDANYDDLVRANSFAFLQGKLCSGAMGSGGTTGTVEGPSVGNCADGIDNDLDGATDCADAGCATDPACASATLNISTATIPSGNLNSTYLTTFSATGGTTPYSWSLTNNGGFSDFSINSFTGSLSGTLDQCPGSYTIAVQVDDATPAASGGPYTDSQSYTLEVTSNLAVSCTSTAGTSITWSSPTQAETFTASGSRLGTINWTLNSGGANGFVVTSTGAADCTLSKTGITTPGTYTFTLTATDASCATNTDDLQFTVQVLASGAGVAGIISGVVDTLTFSTYQSYTPSLVHVTGDIYAVATSGWQNNGYIHSVNVTADGQIGARIAYNDFDGDATTPEMVHISGNVYAIAFEGGGNRGIIKTVTIDAAGNISNTIDELRFINSNCSDPTIVQVSNDIFAVTHTGPGNNGFIITVQIAADGQISNQIIDVLEFDGTNGGQPDLIHISGETYAIVYQGPGGSGKITTVTIDSSTGQISNTVIDTLTFETGNCVLPDVIQVSGEYYAIAYQGPDDDGFVKTIQIAPDGEISNTPIDSLEFDTDTGIEPVIATDGSGIFAVAYRGPDDDGFFKTISIDSSGQISNSVLDTIEFETDACFEPDMVAIGTGLYLIAYRGPTNNQGVLKTIALQ